MTRRWASCELAIFKVATLASDAAILGIVQQQIRQLSALLYEIDPRQAGDLLLEPTRPQKLAQHEPGVVEAQRLIEITGQQVQFRVVRFVLAGRGARCSARSRPGCGHIGT